MRVRIALAASLLAVVTLPAGASTDAAYVRVMSCRGPDAAMEIYAPQVPPHGMHDRGDVMDGFYALDLSGAMKGKHLEPVTLTFSGDGTTMTLVQVTRGLPPTKIPMAGGTVNFDDRFGTQARCSAYSRQL